MDKDSLLESSRHIVKILRTREKCRLNELFNLDSSGLEKICTKIDNANSDDEVLSILETEYRDFLDSVGRVQNSGLIDDMYELKKLSRSIETLWESLDYGLQVFYAAENALSYLDRYKRRLQDVQNVQF